MLQLLCNIESEVYPDYPIREADLDVQFVLTTSMCRHDEVVTSLQEVLCRGFLTCFLICCFLTRFVDFFNGSVKQLASLVILLKGNGQSTFVTCLSVL